MTSLEPTYSQAREQVDKHISIIVTHNSRLKCLFKQFLSDQVKGYDTIMFKNCAILKLSILVEENGNEKNFNIKLNMVHEGEIAENEKSGNTKYFTLNKSSNTRTSVNAIPISDAIEPEIANEVITNTGTQQYGLLYNLLININYADDIQNGGYKEIDFPEIEIPSMGSDKLSYNDFKLLLNILNIHENIKFKNMEYVFYLITDGQAEHNLYTIPQKILKFIKPDNPDNPDNPDTELTAEGRKQATNAGKALLDILPENGKLFTPNDLKDFTLFLSDLRRTHQTLLEILNILNFKSKKLSDFETEQREKVKKVNIAKNIPESNDNTISLIAYVLPCSHELKYINGKVANCDNDNSTIKGQGQICCNSIHPKCLSGPQAPYNRNSCTKMNYGSGSLKFLNIEWKLYDEFYNYNYGDRVYFRQRTPHSSINVNKSKQPRNCSNTNMLAEAINFITDKSKK
jgi:phosphohistidine phosphatase SixA